MSNDIALPISTIQELCFRLDTNPSELESIVSTMPFQFKKYLKKSRSGKVRLIYNPQPALRSMQAPLNKLLSQLPIAAAAHGWRRGHSPATNAAVHIRKQVVLKMDIEDFFPSCHYQRVQQLFLQLGCSCQVAEILMRLTTADHHLPQGFLTSPTIANLLLTRMDNRLQGLSRQRHADYSRFGDDLALSGPVASIQMISLARRIIHESGYKVNEKKFAENGIRFSTQQQEICAITVNDKLNLRKKDLRRYRDLLHRCVAYGPVCEIHDGETLLHMKARLQGYVNYVRGINRHSALQLQGKFNQIIWSLEVGED